MKYFLPTSIGLVVIAVFVFYAGFDCGQTYTLQQLEASSSLTECKAQLEQETFRADSIANYWVNVTVLAQRYIDSMMTTKKQLPSATKKGKGKH